MRRSETEQRIRLAAAADGLLTGLAHEAVVSNLPEESFSEPVAQATHFLYGGANRRYVHEVARVNLTCAGSVRAPGEAVGMLALENAMDELAHEDGDRPGRAAAAQHPRPSSRDRHPVFRALSRTVLERGGRAVRLVGRDPVPASRREGEW